MNRLNINIRLLISFVILLLAFGISQSFFRKQHTLEYADTMTESVKLTKEWFGIIENYKQERGIKSDAGSDVPYNFMIGDEWSAITTTLGSLEAKEISTNPDFSALMVRLLHEAGIKPGEKVGLILSGSFPSLAVSTMAALQTMDIDAVVMSSLGASTYGANQPDATWIDMESVLRRQGGLKFKSLLVSPGAGEDAGTGLPDEGLSLIKNAAVRNNVDLYMPDSLIESINKRKEIFDRAGVSLLINIGGNETALGSCAHSTTIPNGFHKKLATCSDEGRGLIVRMNEEGLPVINMLYIKDVASRYGIDVSPGTGYAESISLYSSVTTNRIAIAVILIISLVPVYFLLRKKGPDNTNKL